MSVHWIIQKRYQNTIQYYPKTDNFLINLLLGEIECGEDSVILVVEQSHKRIKWTIQQLVEKASIDTYIKGMRVLQAKSGVSITFLPDDPEYTVHGINWSRIYVEAEGGIYVYEERNSTKSYNPTKSTFTFEERESSGVFHPECWERPCGSSYPIHCE